MLTSIQRGGGEIRTHGPVAQTPVFKTGAIDHSATPPRYSETDAHVEILYHNSFLF